MQAQTYTSSQFRNPINITSMFLDSNLTETFVLTSSPQVGGGGLQFSLLGFAQSVTQQHFTTVNSWLDLGSNIT